MELEKKEFFDALSEIKQEISKKMEETKSANDERAGELKAQIAELTRQKDEIQAHLDTIQTEIEKQKKTPSQESVSFAKELKTALQKDIEKLKEKGGKETYELKHFLESANASITTGSELPIAFREPGISKAPDRGLHLWNIIPKVPVSNGRIVYVERKTRTDNSEWTAEGAATASQSVLGYATQEVTFKKMSEFIKVSREAMDDIDFIMSEINDELITLLLLKLDAQMLDGLAGSYSFNGIDYYSQAFAPGYTCAAGVAPNEFDVISASANQVIQSHFNPTHCLVSVKKYGEMKLLRDENNGNYLFPWFAQNSLLSIDGVTVVPNTDVDDDDFYTFDQSKVKLYIRKGLEVEVFDQNENDALADLKTIRASMRCYLLLKSNDANAFVKGTFTAAKTTLTAEGA